VAPAAEAATLRWRPSSDCKRYIRLKVVGSDAGDASGSSATIELLA
jgi:hypothetical protein